MLVGDNIYHWENNEWQQANSHHSLSDGTPNPINIETDTKSPYVLISNKFYYFGSESIKIPSTQLEEIGYKNAINHRRFQLEDCLNIIRYIEKHTPNYLHGDPYDFNSAISRYAGTGSKIN